MILGTLFVFFYILFKGYPSLEMSLLLIIPMIIFAIYFLFKEELYK